MPGSVDYEKTLGIIRVVNSGRVTVDEIKDRTLETIEKAVKHRTNLIIVDDTNLELAVSTNELFRLPEFYENSKAYRGSRWAVIQRSEGQDRKDHRFYETSCQNRGWLVKLFSDRQEAIAGS